VVGERSICEREEAVMPSLREFAKKAGLTPKRLYEIESGSGPVPTLEEIHAIASALGLPVWRLLQLAEEEGEQEDK